MEILVRKSQDVTIVELTGDMDGNSAPEAQTQMLQLAEADTKIVLDMTKVPYMSSAGLRMLLVVYRTVKSRGGTIVLVGLSEELRDTMALTGFLDFFEHMKPPTRNSRADLAEEDRMERVDTYPTHEHRGINCVPESHFHLARHSYLEESISRSTPVMQHPVPLCYLKKEHHSLRLKSHFRTSSGSGMCLP